DGGVTRGARWFANRLKALAVLVAAEDLPDVPLDEERFPRVLLDLAVEEQPDVQVRDAVSDPAHRDPLAAVDVLLRLVVLVDDRLEAREVRVVAVRDRVPVLPRDRPVELDAHAVRRVLAARPARVPGLGVVEGPRSDREDRLELRRHVEPRVAGPAADDAA